MMGGDELSEQCKTLRLMVAATTDEDVSPTDLRHAFENMSSRGSSLIAEFKALWAL